MQDAEIRFFEFGEFRLDARRRVLTKRGEPVQLKNRHFELLLVLVENEGRIVSQDELIEKVWEGAFVEQSNLKKGVSALRQILGESATDGEFIKTIPRKGYSFVAPVRALADAAAEPVIYKETKAEITGEEIEIAKEQALTATNDVETISESAEIFRETKPPSRLFVKKRRIIFAAFILVSLSTAILFGWRLLSTRTSALDLSRMRIVPVTTLGNVSGGGISRNGEYIYFGVSERGKVSLWLKHLKTGKVTPLLLPQKIHIYASDFAPDNESIYFWLADDDEPSRNGVYKINIAGGEPQKISDKGWASLNFSPDGKRVAYHRPGVNEQNESGVFTANPDGSDEKLIFPFGGKLALGIIDWSPDGRFITYAANRIKDNQKEYFIAQVPVSGGDEQIIVPPRPQPIFSAMWFPDGSGLAMTAVDEKT
jgi:DNA-binding winged helix-turn-helix (wHTH) protein